MLSRLKNWVVISCEGRQICLAYCSWTTPLHHKVKIVKKYIGRIHGLFYIENDWEGKDVNRLIVVPKMQCLYNGGIKQNLFYLIFWRIVQTATFLAYSLYWYPPPKLFINFHRTYEKLHCKTILVLRIARFFSTDRHTNR